MVNHSPHLSREFLKNSRDFQNCLRYLSISIDEKISRLCQPLSGDLTELSNYPFRAIFLIQCGYLSKRSMHWTLVLWLNHLRYLLFIKRMQQQRGNRGRQLCQRVRVGFNVLIYPENEIKTSKFAFLGFAVPFWFLLVDHRWTKIAPTFKIPTIQIPTARPDPVNTQWSHCIPKFVNYGQTLTYLTLRIPRLVHAQILSK